MIKLAYVIDVLDTNLAGTENQLIKMINGLDKATFAVNLVCLRDHPWLRENGAMLDCTKQVIDVRYFAKASTYRNLFELWRYFRATKPDVVHTFFPLSNIVGVVAARLAGVRGVISSRRDYGEWMSPRYLFLTKVANRFARRIVANSENVRSLTVGREGVSARKVEVVLNGIEHESFQLSPDHALKRRLGIPESNRIVGIVANFRPMKHHETFVQAAAQVLKVRQDVDFLLVGGTASTLSRKEALESLARSLGVGAKLHFVGVQSDVRPYLSVMDIGVNCSEREGLSNAVMEYMAAGIPAIVSRSGGNTDLITEAVSGLTFELGDAPALARHMLYLLDDEPLRRTLAANARAKVMRDMSPNGMLRRYEALYREVAVC